MSRTICAEAAIPARAASPGPRATVMLKEFCSRSSSPSARLVFPALRPLTVTLRITDEGGRSDTVSKTIDSVALKAGGGGGAFPAWALALLLAVWLARLAAPRRDRN